MNELAGFITIGMLIFLQLIAFAYGYGKLNQKVNDSCNRLTRIEKSLNGINSKKRGEQ
jgi:NRPS condensation-like uncharacterized protein